MARKGENGGRLTGDKEVAAALHLGRQWCFHRPMPVSKKRKKDGKPARRAAPVPPPGEHPHGPEARPQSPLLQRMGKPSNPFVAQMPKRAAQRGR